MGPYNRLYGASGAVQATCMEERPGQRGLNDKDHASRFTAKLAMLLQRTFFGELMVAATDRVPASARRFTQSVPGAVRLVQPRPA